MYVTSISISFVVSMHLYCYHSNIMRGSKPRTSGFLVALYGYHTYIIKHMLYGMFVHKHTTMSQCRKVAHYQLQNIHVATLRHVYVVFPLKAFRLVTVLL